MNVTKPDSLEGAGPWGDSAHHLPMETLEAKLATFSPPTNTGELSLIVVRQEDGKRDTPKHVTLTPGDGIPGDAWMRKDSQKLDAQISIMRIDVAQLFANGQPLSLMGDNLLVDLDLSLENLPAGSRLRVGAAILEVTPAPHDGCRKFKQRFGGDALRMTAAPQHRELRLRGLYAKVVEEGAVTPGNPIEIISRGNP